MNLQNKIKDFITQRLPIILGFLTLFFVRHCLFEGMTAKSAVNRHWYYMLFDRLITLLSWTSFIAFFFAQHDVVRLRKWTLTGFGIQIGAVSYRMTVERISGLAPIGTIACGAHPNEAPAKFPMKNYS